MSQVNLNASQDSSLDVTDNSINSALNSSSLSISEDKKEQKKQLQEKDQRKKRKCQRITFIVIITLLIVIMFINGIRSLSEKYSSTKLDEPEVIVPVTKCNQTENFMTFEPCWDDYTPKRSVDAMRDIYRLISQSNGGILSDKMKVGLQEFQNPLNELMSESEQKQFFLFRNITGDKGNLYDVYIMPTNDDDAENLQLLQETLEFEERAVDDEEKEDLMVPGFKRTIEHCDDLSECEQAGIIEVSEMYTELTNDDFDSYQHDEFKRVINFKDDSQTMTRTFKDCLLNNGDQVLQKLVQMKPHKTIKTQQVKLKKKGWQLYEPFVNFDCHKTEVFE